MHTDIYETNTYDYKLFGNYQYLNAITTVTQISPIPLTCPTGQVLIERFCCSTGYYLDGIDCVKSCPYNKLLNSVSNICESPKDGLCQTEKQLRDYKTCVTTHTLLHGGMRPGDRNEFATRQCQMLATRENANLPL